MAWQSDGPQGLFICLIILQQYLCCKETVMECCTNVMASNGTSASFCLPPPHGADNDWGSSGVLLSMSGRQKFEILLWQNETCFKTMWCVQWPSDAFISCLQGHTKALVYLRGTSYSDTFSKPGAIPWLLGTIKSKENLCPQKGALETRTEEWSIKSLVDWFSHLLRSWLLYLLASRKLDQQNFLPWTPVPGI